MTSTTELAVQRCLDAYNKACAIEDAGNDHSLESLQRVNRAYRHAMPFLTSDPEAIDAFIACVTHGLIYEIFPLAEASKLLYAAQVAITSRRARTEAARQNSKSESKPTGAGAPEPALSLSKGPSPLTTNAGAPGPSPSGTWERSQQTPTPLPPGNKGTEAPAPEITKKSMQAEKNQVEELLAQFFAGKPAPQPFSPTLKKAPAQAPPPPSTHTGTNALTR
jgi:hypothetical protein